MTIPKRTKRLISDTFQDYKFGFKTDIKNVYSIPKGISPEVIREISKQKNEPKWMLDFRLKALEIFNKKPLPTWGGDLSHIDFANLHYYIKAQAKTQTSWNNVDPQIKEAFETLGIPEAEKKFLHGVSAQFESEVVYESVQEALSKKGVIFVSTDEALKKHPELFREYFGKIIPATDNKFAALNSAVWSGGTFIYVPKGVHIDLPLQAYFRMNAKNMGQFERTLIIADEGSSVHYIEGCTAPIYSSNSLHSAVVEIIAKKGAKIQYTTLQDWAHNIYNLVTKRSFVYENAQMIWVDCNMGSKLTMKYPAIFLLGENARGEIHSLAFASQNQHQDSGGKIIHAAPNTSSIITSKSISKNGGRSTYRGLLKINKNAINAKSKVSCDALILDDKSRSDTYPTMKIEEKDVELAHEATVSKIGEDQLFYLTSRGISEAEASSMIVNGFAEPIIKHLPMEYAVELNRLLETEMTGSVG
ncbi:MAG: Fe-S cluster assembly protein SufB [Candidatus Gracilibacteria bacterium]|jgi:Fe-S cluster assembly protein SufB